MFNITDHKGVQFTFPNGFILSVQWGPGNYGDHSSHRDYSQPQKEDNWSSSQAEVAVIDARSMALLPLGYDTVLGYLSVTQVAKIMAVVVAATDAASLSAQVEALMEAPDWD
jgi:hypothetical protein